MFGFVFDGAMDVQATISVEMSRLTGNQLFVIFKEDQLISRS